MQTSADLITASTIRRGMPIEATRPSARAFDWMRSKAPSHPPSNSVSSLP
jgi:hypothetical protein